MGAEQQRVWARVSEEVCGEANIGHARGGADGLTINRNLGDGADESKDGIVRERREMAVQIQPSTYKILYERGSEDVLWTSRSDDDHRALQLRASTREDERRRRVGRLLVGRL